MSLRGLLYQRQLSVLTALAVIIIQVPATGEINFGWVGADTASRGEVGWLAEGIWCIYSHRPQDSKMLNMKVYVDVKPSGQHLFMVLPWGTVIQCSPRAALLTGTKATIYLWPGHLGGTLAQGRKGNGWHGRQGGPSLELPGTSGQWDKRLFLGESRYVTRSPFVTEGYHLLLHLWCKLLWGRNPF